MLFGFLCPRLVFGLSVLALVALLRCLINEMVLRLLRGVLLLCATFLGKSQNKTMSFFCGGSYELIE